MYYAHLASNRAVAHVDMNAADTARINKEKRDNRGVYKVSDGSETEIPKLLAMQPDSGIHMGMWYI